MSEVKSCREMLVIFMNRIIRLFVLVFFFNHVSSTKSTPKNSPKRPAQGAGEKGGWFHFQLRWEQARSASLVSDSAKRQEGRLRSQQQKALQALLKRIQRDRGEQNLGLNS